MLRRDVRYQAAIVRDHQVLLLKGVDRVDGSIFWIFPGGGREPGESVDACLRREIYEETYLEIAVVRLLFEVPDGPGGIYDWLRTYLCAVVRGEERPGVEPEVDDDHFATIRALQWFDLRDPKGWDALLANSITLLLLNRLRTALGYHG